MVESEPQPTVEPTAEPTAENQPPAGGPPAPIEPSAEDTKLFAETEEEKEEVRLRKEAEEKERQEQMAQSQAQGAPAQQEEEKKDGEEGPKLAWDGEPLLEQAEIERQKELFAWLVEDLKTFEKSMTAEEMKTQEDLCAEMRKPDNEGGDEVRRQFNEQFDAEFATANVSADGFLKEDEFKVWMNAMNDLAVRRGLKHREHTDEYLTRCWQTFNGHKVDEEGVSKKSCVYVLRYCAM